MASTHRLISFDDAQGQFATLELFQAEPVRPVVILCGWTGSAMRMMKGYSAWYRAQNYHVVTLPTRFHFGLTSSVYSLERLRREMDPLLDALLEHTPYIFDPQSSEKLIIQVWSNGGSHTLCHILDNLEERSKKSGKEVKFRNPVLLTMDSAPNLPTPNQPMTGASLSWGAIRGYGRFINPSVMGKVCSKK